MQEFGFGEEVLMLAVEGCKASRFCQGENRMRMRLDDFSWILQTERRIEQLAEIGAKARAEFEAHAQAAPAEVTTQGEVQTAEMRERLKALRRFLVGRGAR